MPPANKKSTPRNGSARWKKINSSVVPIDVDSWRKNTRVSYPWHLYVANDQPFLAVFFTAFFRVGAFTATTTPLALTALATFNRLVSRLRFRDAAFL